MKWMIMLILSIMFIPFVFGQAVPVDVDASTLQIVVQEHKNTRKFFSDELTRQRTEFFNTMEQQAKEYENKADSIVTDAVWKLSLLWAGIVFFVFGMSNFLGRKLDKRKWNKMLDSAKAEIMTDVNQQKAKIDAVHQQREEKIVKATQTLTQKESALESQGDIIKHKRESLNKARPQLIAMQTKIAEQQKELRKVMGDLQLFENHGEK